MRRRDKTRWIPQNYKELHRSESPDLVVYGDDRFAIAYSGKRTNHDWHHSFANVGHRDKYIAEWIESMKKTYQFKQELKAERKQKPSTHSLVAKIIRKELKHYFPGILFRVRSNYHSINIDYADGPTQQMIKKIVDKYEMGYFDGMEDIYKYTNRRDDIPQVMYVFVNRHMSETVGQNILNRIRKTLFNCENLELNDYSKDHNAYGHTLVWREFQKMQIWN